MKMYYWFMKISMSLIRTYKETKERVEQKRQEIKIDLYYITMILIRIK